EISAQWDIHSNDFPNFKGRMFNVQNRTSTLEKNFTMTDPIWSGAALWASTSETFFVNGSNYNIPAVFTELTGSGDDPANFHYAQNINFSASEFTQSFGDDIPEITLIGDNPYYVYLGETYIDPGTIAVDCRDGNISSNIQINTSGLNVNARGTHT